MSNKKLNIHVRQARKTDGKTVFKFCEKTWDWGDYIEHVWDKWLKEKNGRVFVATIEGVPVGISHISIDKPSEAWLSGARTDPKWRRQGIASAITEKCLEYAKRRGVKVARLMTESFNLTAQSLLPKLGFQPIATFAETELENVTVEKNSNTRWAMQDEIEAIWNYLSTSETYRKAAGLYTVMFHYFSLDKQDLENFVEQQNVLMHCDKKGKVDGVVLISDAPKREWNENLIQTCYADGAHSTMLDIVGFLKTYCHQNGIKRILGLIPNQKQIVKAFIKQGFAKPKSINIIYEKKL
ncbi:MAG: GNAT family N-acetyltransferase [Candidatus Bathyarchaeia archaeon]